MKQKYDTMGGNARQRRDSAGKTIPSILKSAIFGRPFDPVAYAAALEVLG